MVASELLFGFPAGDGHSHIGVVCPVQGRVGADVLSRAATHCDGLILNYFLVTLVVNFLDTEEADSTKHIILPWI